MRLHDDEVPIDTDLVRRLLRDQTPDLAALDVRPAPTQGTDNLMFRLGSDLVVRLPRKPAAVHGLLVERRWLSVIAGHLPLAVPQPLIDGEPSAEYPFPWAICRWLPGRPLPPGGLSGDAYRSWRRSSPRSRAPTPTRTVWRVLCRSCRRDAEPDR